MMEFPLMSLAAKIIQECSHVVTLQGLAQLLLDLLVSIILLKFFLHMIVTFNMIYTMERREVEDISAANTS
jgi:hypothetical protein